MVRGLLLIALVVLAAGVALGAVVGYGLSWLVTTTIDAMGY